MVDRPGAERAAASARRDREPGCLAPGRAPGWEPAWVAALGFQDTLRPPTGARWGLRGSYDGEFTGLGSRWSAPFTRDAWDRLGTPGGLRLLQLGGVSHVLRARPSTVPGLELLETRATPYVCPLQVLRVPDPLPGAYVGAAERAPPTRRRPSRVLLDPGFDPRSEVVLADGPRPRPGAPRARTTVRVVSRRLDALEVEAQLAAPGVLVVLEAFEPGWSATVDGRAGAGAAGERAVPGRAARRGTAPGPLRLPAPVGRVRRRCCRALGLAAALAARPASPRRARD